MHEQRFDFVRLLPPRTLLRLSPDSTCSDSTSSLGISCYQLRELSRFTSSDSYRKPKEEPPKSSLAISSILSQTSKHSVLKVSKASLHAPSLASRCSRLPISTSVSAPSKLRIIVQTASAQILSSFPSLVTSARRLSISSSAPTNHPALCLARFSPAEKTNLIRAISTDSNPDNSPFPMDQIVQVMTSNNGRKKRRCWSRKCWQKRNFRQSRSGIGKKSVHCR